MKPHLPTLLFAGEHGHTREHRVRVTLDGVPLLLAHPGGKLVGETRVPQTPLVLPALLLLPGDLLLVSGQNAVFQPIFAIL